MEDLSMPGRWLRWSLTESSGPTRGGRSARPGLDVMEGRLLMTVFSGSSFAPLPPTTYPKDAIVRFDAEFQMKSGPKGHQKTVTQHIYGSGALIGNGKNDEVLTAAHL